MQYNISDYRNIHNGKAVSIIGTGPSLNNTDPRKLAGLGYSITLNDAILWRPESRYSFIPDAPVLARLEYLCNVGFSTSPLRGTAKVHSVRINYLGKWAGDIQKGNYGTIIQKMRFGEYGFSFDLEQGIFVGDSSAHGALQLAVWIGFKEIYMVGVDLADSGKLTHFNGSWNNSGDRTLWFSEVQKAFTQARAVIPQDIKLYNCSPLRGPDAFEKVVL